MPTTTHSPTTSWSSRRAELVRGPTTDPATIERRRWWTLAVLNLSLLVAR